MCSIELTSHLNKPKHTDNQKGSSIVSEKAKIFIVTIINARDEIIKFFHC